MIENERIEEMMFELEEKSENTINALENEYNGLRTGRANPKILDKIEVEAYGGMSRLIELGNVSALDARCLQINLWDKSLLKAVEKAILQYKYLDKNYGIRKGEKKFTLDKTSENENILFNKKINVLNKKYNEIYYI